MANRTVKSKPRRGNKAANHATEAPPTPAEPTAEQLNALPAETREAVNAALNAFWRAESKAADAKLDIPELRLRCGLVLGAIAVFEPAKVKVLAEDLRIHSQGYSHAAHPLSTALTFLRDATEGMNDAARDIHETSASEPEDRAHLFDALQEIHYALAHVEVVRGLVEKEINPKPAKAQS